MSAPAIRRAGWWRGFRRLRQNSLSLLGLFIVVVALMVALAAPLLVPYPHDLVGAVDTAIKFQPPNARHWFGTNEVGQDVLSLVIGGTRVSLLAGIAVVALGTISGGAVGACAGYFGGLIDEVLMRFTDLMLTVPSLILAMAVAAALGGGLGEMILAIALSWWPGYARLVRGEVVAKKQEQFVQAALAIGAGSGRILGRHILPNIVSRDCGESVARYRLRNPDGCIAGLHRHRREAADAGVGADAGGGSVESAGLLVDGDVSWAGDICYRLRLQPAG